MMKKSKNDALNNLCYASYDIGYEIQIGPRTSSGSCTFNSSSKEDALHRASTEINRRFKGAKNINIFLN
ncbi:hypothetical protein [Bacillus cereus]|uniref:Uncharacterized protein n=2 Tax=Bacillus cereus group TaxID=86661 RepID=R8MDV7_BACCX|nr:hypothetical protein [Bacillus cereus]EOP32316.1 hypothetical protein IK1_05852 [Bacillus cereus VD146]RGP43005.1 hypothetical protein BTW32_30275 [Bacillus thuringiensis]